MISPNADHYVVTVVDLPPRDLLCKCGHRETGDGCLDRMTAHVREGNDDQQG